MRELRLGPLYPITAMESALGSSHLQQVETYLDTGIRLFQVRDKLLDDEALYRQLLQIRQLCSAENASFIVNDRVDLAQASGAAGVHLGQKDLPVAAAREILGNESVIGISTHDREQFLEAQRADVDYVAVGPIFHTGTKESDNEPLGLDFLRAIAKKRNHPLVAIGGIQLDNVHQVWKAGADSVAVVSDIAASQDPANRIYSYLDRWQQC